MSLGHELLDAAWSGNLELVKSICRKTPIATKARDKDGWTASHCAAYNGWTEMLEFFGQEFPELLTVRDKNGWTTAHYAAFAGQTDTLTQLNHLDPSLLEIKTNNGSTTAHKAAAKGRLDALKVIIEAAPALMFEPNEDGERPMDIATGKDVSDFLGEMKIKYEEENKPTEPPAEIQKDGDEAAPIDEYAKVVKNEAQAPESTPPPAKPGPTKVKITS